jgi:hypothetical protein
MSTTFHSPQAIDQRRCTSSGRSTLPVLMGTIIVEDRLEVLD